MRSSIWLGGLVLAVVTFRLTAPVAAGPVTPGDLAPPADVADVPLHARRTASGVVTKVVVRGPGKTHPQRNDCVRLRYTAWTRNGDVAGTSSNADAGEIACLRRMTPGLAEAVAIMVVGERRRLWIPAALAFPSDPDEAPPERKADLTYDLALMEIIAAPPTPPTLSAPPRRARRLPSGVAVEILKKGNGQIHPGDANQMTLHLAAWSRDGTLIESTRMGGQPAVFRISELVPGLREGVRELVVGDVARLWIPAALGYGDKPRSRSQPAGPLLYEVELVRLE